MEFKEDVGVFLAHISVQGWNQNPRMAIQFYDTKISTSRLLKPRKINFCQLILVINVNQNG